MKEEQFNIAVLDWGDNALNKTNQEILEESFQNTEKQPIRRNLTVIDILLTWIVLERSHPSNILSTRFKKILLHDRQKLDWQLIWSSTQMDILHSEFLVDGFVHRIQWLPDNTGYASEFEKKGNVCHGNW